MRNTEQIYLELFSVKLSCFPLLVLIEGLSCSIIIFADVATPANALNMPSQHRSTEAENHRHNHLLPDLHSKDVSQDRPRTDVNFVRSPGSEDGRLPWKAGKVPRSSNTCSKRARSTQVEDAPAITLADEVKGLTDKSLTRNGSLGNC